MKRVFLALESPSGVFSSELGGMKPYTVLMVVTVSAIIHWPTSRNEVAFKRERRKIIHHGEKRHVWTDYKGISHREEDICRGTKRRAADLENSAERELEMKTESTDPRAIPPLMSTLIAESSCD